MTQAHSALLVVDVQKDFCPGGALPVRDGDRIIPVLNQYVAAAEAEGWVVYASRDWHPPLTRHFQPYGGEWPPHGVQDTDGARFHEKLRLPATTIIVSKGQDPDDAGYSAFQGETGGGLSLLKDMRGRGIDRLYVGGLATDYCVKHSVLDARRAGLDVTVLLDGVAGVDRTPGDSARAIEEMRQAGASIATFDETLGKGHAIRPGISQER
jgi:nicotinamidase/pyrazinamidase